MEPAAVPTASTALRVLRLFDAALTGVGARGPIARDAVFAGLVTLASLLVLVPLLGPAAARMGLVFTPAERSLVLILVAVQTLFLVLRRVQPTICLIAVAALQVGLVAVLPVDAGIRMAAPVMAAYSVGAHLATRAAVRAVAAAFGIEVLVGGIVAALVAPTARSLVEPSVGGSTWSTLIPVWLLDQASIMVLYVGAALAGMVVASRRSYTALLQEQMMAVVAQEQGRVRTAVATERSRMARELHDIAAHHLSGLVVQAGAIERLIDRDPEAAKRATGVVRAEGKETLANLRAVVGVLRESTPSTAADGTGSSHLDAESSAPVPGLAVVDQLLDAARTNGDDLDVTVAGEPYVLPPIADITSYRVLQESLANARQHAPGNGSASCWAMTRSSSNWKSPTRCPSPRLATRHEPATDSSACRSEPSSLGRRSRQARSSGPGGYGWSCPAPSSSQRVHRRMRRRHDFGAAGRRPVGGPGRSAGNPGVGR